MALILSYILLHTYINYRFVRQAVKIFPLVSPTRVKTKHSWGTMAVGLKHAYIMKYKRQVHAGTSYVRSFATLSMTRAVQCPLSVIVRNKWGLWKSRGVLWLWCHDLLPNTPRLPEKGVRYCHTIMLKFVEVRIKTFESYLGFIVSIHVYRSVLYKLDPKTGMRYLTVYPVCLLLSLSRLFPVRSRRRRVSKDIRPWAVVRVGFIFKLLL